LPSVAAGVDLRKTASTRKTGLIILDFSFLFTYDYLKEYYSQINIYFNPVTKREK